MIKEYPKQKLIIKKYVMLAILGNLKKILNFLVSQFSRDFA